MNMTHDEVETNRRLKLIANLEQGQKLHTKTQTAQNLSIYTSLYRTVWYPENRYEGVGFCRETIVKSLELLEKYKGDGRVKACLKHDLVGAMRGLSYLKQVYVSDKKITGDIDLSIEMIEGVVGEREKILDVEKSEEVVSGV